MFLVSWTLGTSFRFCVLVSLIVFWCFMYFLNVYFVYDFILNKKYN